MREILIFWQILCTTYIHWPSLIDQMLVAMTSFASHLWIKKHKTNPMFNRSLKCWELGWHSISDGQTWIHYEDW